MINDHSNQHSNTYPFHGDRSDHLEKRNWFKNGLDHRRSTDIIEKNIICHVSHVICKMSDFGWHSEIEIVKELESWDQPGELTREWRRWWTPKRALGAVLIFMFQPQQIDHVITTLSVWCNICRHMILD